MSKEQVGGQQEGKFYSVVGGTFRTRVPENHPEAVSRVNKKGVTVYEKEVRALFGKIENITVYEGDFGKNLNITLDPNEDGEVPVASFIVDSRDGEDVMKKLPNVDFSKEVKIAPYRFIPEGEAKERSGVSIFQQDENGEFRKKLENYFWDGKNALHGMPSIDWDKASEADKKIHFIKVNAVLVEYLEKNILPKFVEKAPTPTTEEDSINPEDIPF